MRRALEIGLDVLGFLGLGAMIYGTWLVYQPAGFIVGGAAALASSVILPRYLG